MKCAWCKNDFPESKLQLSHDVPKYIGGTDKDGRHYLCLKCHDIYERMIMAFMIRVLSEEDKNLMRSQAKVFAKIKLGEKESDTKATSD